MRRVTGFPRLFLFLCGRSRLIQKSWRPIAKWHLVERAPRYGIAVSFREYFRHPLVQAPANSGILPVFLPSPTIGHRSKLLKKAN